MNKFLFFFSSPLESLNRNCFLTLLACVSPSKLDTKETLSTLRFAENVGTLKNNPKINVIMNEITMARRKTPTKQMFTPRPNSTFKSNRVTMNNTLKKKVLNFPGPAQNNNKTTSLARKSVQPMTHQIDNRRPTMTEEQDFSFATNNISTSTFINHHPLMDQTQNLQPMSYSPVIRQCMSTFESKLDERISAAVNDIANKLMNNSTMVDQSSKRTSTMNGGGGGCGLEPPKRRRTRNSQVISDCK